MEITYAMIKPDAVANGHTGKIVEMIEKAGFDIVQMKKWSVPTALVEAFYQEHAQKSFFRETVDFITSGPIVSLALKKDNAILAWRELMGTTDPSKAAAGTVRSLFGTDIGKNAVHGSDSSASAARELAIIFHKQLSSL